MTGGNGSSPESLDSIEQLDPNSLEWKSASNLPEPFYGHCAVSINATTILIIGGGEKEEGSAKTFFFHHQDGKFSVSTLSDSNKAL